MRKSGNDEEDDTSRPKPADNPLNASAVPPPIWMPKEGLQRRAKITAGTLVSGVTYTGSLTAAQIVSGTIAANIGYLRRLNASQVNAGGFVGCAAVGALLGILKGDRKTGK